MTCTDKYYITLSVNELEDIKHLEQLVRIIRNESLYGNLGKRQFFSIHAVFLGFIVSSEGIKADEKKVQAIKE